MAINEILQALNIRAEGGHITECDWVDSPKWRPHDGDDNMAPEDIALVCEAKRQLLEYLQGDRRTFTLPLALKGTPFQVSVWQELLQIPYGSTLSYQALATKLGMPKCVRAVANAVGANRLSIFVPCHRIISASGAIGGYRGGLKFKAALLELERNLKSL